MQTNPSWADILLSVLGDTNVLVVLVVTAVPRREKLRITLQVYRYLARAIFILRGFTISFLFLILLSPPATTSLGLKSWPCRCQTFKESYRLLSSNPKIRSLAYNGQLITICRGSIWGLGDVSPLYTQNVLVKYFIHVVSFGYNFSIYMFEF